MIVKLLTEHHLEFLSLKGGCRGSSKSTFVKMSSCWESHATGQFYMSTHALLNLLSQLGKLLYAQLAEYCIVFSQVL